MTGTAENLAGTASQDSSAFQAEVARLRERGVLGESGRLLDLFNFLAGRGESAEAASQAEIAEMVFGQTNAESDDATVRVYIHRLRKRLEEHYSSEEPVWQRRLSIPPGTYALRLERPSDSDTPENNTAARRSWAKGGVAAAVLLVVLLGAFLLGQRLSTGQQTVPVNSVWQPFIESERPIMVVVGDYYMFGEIDYLSPQDGRLIRDFQINSKTDLARAQQFNPDRYGDTEDFGLTYLPVSSAYALRSIMPVLAQHRAPVSIMPASEVNSDTFRYFNIVYVGLFSGMGLLEDVNFMRSSLAVGESYDELIDLDKDQHFVSEEARKATSANYYTDYAYLSVFTEPGGALVGIVAGARDTGLRGIAPIAVSEDLPQDVESRAEEEGSAGFEALFEVTGQQGADLNEKLLLSRRRP